MIFDSIGRFKLPPIMTFYHCELFNNPFRLTNVSDYKINVISNQQATPCLLAAGQSIELAALTAKYAIWNLCFNRLQIGFKRKTLLLYSNQYIAIPFKTVFRENHPCISNELGL